MAPKRKKSVEENPTFLGNCLWLFCLHPFEVGFCCAFFNQPGIAELCTCCFCTHSKFASIVSVVQSFSNVFEQHCCYCSEWYKNLQSGYWLLWATQILHQLFKHLLDMRYISSHFLRKVVEPMIQKMLKSWNFPDADTWIWFPLARNIYGWWDLHSWMQWARAWFIEKWT